MNKQKGLAPILIILLIALAVGGYLLYQKQTKLIPQPQNPSVISQTPQPTSSSQLKKLSVEEIRQELSKIEALNKSKEFNSKDYPKIIGIDARNGEELFIGYSCIDICPQYGHLYLGYKKIKNTPDCNSIKGEVIEAGIPMPEGTFNYCKPTLDSTK